VALAAQSDAEGVVAGAKRGASCRPFFNWPEVGSPLLVSCACVAAGGGEVIVSHLEGQGNELLRGWTGLPAKAPTVRGDRRALEGRPSEIRATGSRPPAQLEPFHER